MQRDVGSRPETDVYAIRSLLSCRWLFDPENRGETFADSSTGQTRMPGWTYYATQNGSRIYENEYFIPMGFGYESYITRSEYDALPEANRSLALLKSLVVEDADAGKVADLLPHNDGIQSADFSTQAVL